MYVSLLSDGCSFADRDWIVSSFSVSAGYWGDGVSSGNEGIRTIVSMVLACATLVKHGGLEAAVLERLSERAQAAIRYAIATHRTGAQLCMDGKPWGAMERFGGESWQSGMWTGTLAFGVWLMWDRLSDDEQNGVQRVVAWEADILAHRPPPTNLWLDTKAEENGWEVPCLTLAVLMFPRHPHAALWHEAMLTYMMNTLCTAADMQDAQVVDGRPVKDWVRGANLQPDYTLENHGVFHPTYVGCSCYFMTQAVLYFAFGNQKAPVAATHHLLDTWAMFRRIILPWGEAADPQGMDWELHGVPFFNLFASLATRWRDPFAAHAEQASVQLIRAWQQMEGGSLAPPGSPLGITRHAINAEQSAYGLLAHMIFGSAMSSLDEQRFNATEEGVWESPFVQIVLHRTPRKFISFSWKNRVMGQVIPIGRGLDNNPIFTVPITNGLVGSFELEGAEKQGVPVVIEHRVVRRENGFDTSGALLLEGGKLKQQLRVVSVGDQVVIYEDRVIALVDVTIRGEHGVPLGIENDKVTGGLRRLVTNSLDLELDWTKPRPPIDAIGNWCNVDDRLGLVMLAGKNIRYTQANAYSRGLAVYTDILNGSFHDDVRSFKAGDEIARRVAVIFTDVTSEEMKVLASRCYIEQQTNGVLVRLREPGGKNTRLPLHL